MWNRFDEKYYVFKDVPSVLMDIGYIHSSSIYSPSRVNVIAETHVLMMIVNRVKCT